MTTATTAGEATDGSAAASPSTASHRTTSAPTESGPVDARSDTRCDTRGSAGPVGTVTLAVPSPLTIAARLRRLARGARRGSAAAVSAVAVAVLYYVVLTRGGAR
ncbi:hypothetical protein [Streptomyces mangrovisoli]|uniref:Uncharacterized protein n=1 Tax=Streptomyces mangrovisoli TaxID=1428628 RepID=A0A1J4NPW0_9ACTN|nr:hypothetical protein [Streptomyces mangrovisoli]OIJ64407.1 hypothetical protein WN71_028985 [Streptomyces mangrovisoli]